MTARQHRAYIEDGPHAGVRSVPGLPQETITLVETGSDSLRPATQQRYRRQRPQVGDFACGWEARYRWEP